MKIRGEGWCVGEEEGGEEWWHIGLYIALSLITCSTLSVKDIPKQTRRNDSSEFSHLTIMTKNPRQCSSW